jgi:anaerobic selenocysteine-containing dehydrogenase
MTDVTALRTCPLCEATCGLEITLRDGAVQRIRGDMADPFSKGFICPKGSTLKHLQEDPDRLTTPMVKRDGVHVEATWDEAFDAIAVGLGKHLADDRNSVAVYLGNPNVHNLAAGVFGRVLVQALGSRNVFTASTVDQMPKHVSCGLLYGAPSSLSIPDLDRTDYLLMLGANPAASNGSLCTAPGFPDRLDDIRDRGGSVVLIDPRRSETAAHATEHHPIRPGSDAFLLAAMCNVIIDDGLVDLGSVGSHVSGLDEFRALITPFTVDVAQQMTGIDAATITRLARELAAAPSAAVYARMGANTARFGTVNAWLAEVLTIITGNLDRPGGLMFSTPATGTPVGEKPGGKGWRSGRWQSRVSERNEMMGEIPTVCLAEEIMTPGDGQIRALITLQGNPVLSLADARKTDAALASLDFMVSFDIYLNETTRHADVILPGCSPLERSHYDLAFTGLSVRNVAKWSPPVFQVQRPIDDEILARIALILSGLDHRADPTLVYDGALLNVLTRASQNPHSPAFGSDPLAVVSQIIGHAPADRVLDALLRTGPYGAGFEDESDGLSLRKLMDNPHGLDLGPLEPRFPGFLQTSDGMINVAHESFAQDIVRLSEAMTEPPVDLMLIGRRHLKTNNSWMHNLDILTKGNNRCRVHVHPADAERHGVVDGGQATVKSAAGDLTVEVEVTDTIMPGVVSIPHGWGHSYSGVRLSTAQRRPGVNLNVLTSTELADAWSGNAALNGVPVTLSPV